MTRWHYSLSFHYNLITFILRSQTHWQPVPNFRDGSKQMLLPNRPKEVAFIKGIFYEIASTSKDVTFESKELVTFSRNLIKIIIYTNAEFIENIKAVDSLAKLNELYCTLMFSHVIVNCNFHMVGIQLKGFIYCGD